MTLRSTKRTLSLLVVVASASFACNGGGCGGGSGAGPSASAAPSSSVAATPSVSASHKPIFIHATGPLGTLFRAATLLELKDEQHATLEKIAADLREADKAARAKEADGGGPRDETKAAYAELAAGVKAGKIDVSKMAPHYAAIENGAKQKYEREAEALGQLYAALEPAQRTTLVANLRAAEEKRSVRVKALGARDAGRPDAVRMRLARYTHELKLESDQQRRVEANLPKEDASSIFRDEEAKELEAVVAAFENEGFDPKKIESSLPKKARAAVEDEAKFLAVLVPVLKPDQRELLAKHLARRSGALRPFQPRNSLMGVGGRGHDDGAGDTP